eukprot:4044846-Amphidinium_carterae.1
MHDRGAADNPWCPRCHALGWQVQGTQRHRFLECPFWHDDRCRLLPPATLAWARTQGPGIEHLHILLSSLGGKPMGEFELVHGLAEHEQFTGHVFTDGSAQHPTIKESRVATWAVVQLDMDHPLHAVQLKAYGVIGQQISTRQAATDGELYAALYAIEHSAPLLPLHIHTECKLLYDGLRRGSRSMAHQGALHAHLWRWMALAGADTRVVAHKIKAHQREPLRGHRASESWKYFCWKGNDTADAWAKAAYLLEPDLAQRMSENRMIGHHLEKLAQWAAHQGSLLASGEKTDTTEWPDQWQKRARPAQTHRKKYTAMAAATVAPGVGRHCYEPWAGSPSSQTQGAASEARTSWNGGSSTT